MPTMPVSISVHIQGYTDMSHSMRVRDGDTIGAVKAKISNKSGIPIEHLHMGSFWMSADADD